MKTFYACIFLISLLFFTNACKKQISKEIETSSTENYLLSTQSNVNSGNSAFQKIYGKKGFFYSSSSSVATSNNGIVMCGGFSPNQSPFIPSALILKLDVNGKVVWKNILKYSDSYDDNFYKVKRTSDGGFIVMGTSLVSAEIQSILLVKVDGNGNMIFKKRYNMQEFFILDQQQMDVIETSDGGYAFTCHLQSGTLVDKISQNGSIVWSKIYNIKNDGVTAYEIQGYALLDENDNLVLTGSFYSTPNGAFLLKLNKNTGLPVYSKSYFDTEIPGLIDGFYNIENKNGNYYISGNRNSNALFAKLDINGNVLLSKSMPTVYGFARKSKLTSDDGFIVLDAYGSSGTFIYKVNSQFQLEWAKQFQYANATGIEGGIAQLANGSYAFSLTYIDNSPGSTNESKILVSKTDQFGNSCLNQNYQVSTQNFTMQTSTPEWEVTQGINLTLSGEPIIGIFPNSIKRLCSSSIDDEDEDDD